MSANHRPISLCVFFSVESYIERTKWKVEGVGERVSFNSDICFQKRSSWSENLKISGLKLCSSSSFEKVFHSYSIELWNLFTNSTREKQSKHWLTAKLRHRMHTFSRRNGKICAQLNQTWTAQGCILRQGPLQNGSGT